MKFIFISIILVIPHLNFAQSTATAWANQFGSTSADAGTGIKVDPNGDVITVGWFRGTVDFDAGPNEWFLTSKGSTDVFVIKMSFDGKLIWAKSFGGKQLDQAQDLCIDQSGDIYITGNFQDEINFEPLLNSTIKSQGFKDAFVVKFNTNGDLLWVNQMNGSLDEYGKSISVDKNKNVFVSGYFQGNFDVETISGSATMNSKGGDDIFIAKLNENGYFIWAFGMGGRLDDESTCVATDQDNHVLLYGNFNDTIDIAPGTDRFLLREKGNGDSYILKLDNDGKFLWVDHFSGKDVVGASRLAIDQSGNIFATGTFRSEADFDPGLNTDFKMTAPGIYGDAFVLKLNSKGDFIWAKQLGGTQQENGLGIYVDLSGDVFTTGCHQFKADFDPGPGEYFLYSDSTNNNDIYLSKLDGFGNFVFAQAFNGKKSDIGFAIATNNNNLIYTTGIFGATVDFSPGDISRNNELISQGLEDAFVHCLIQNYLNVGDADNLSRIQVYPNPCDVALNIIFKNKVQEILEVNLYNLQGQMVLSNNNQNYNMESNQFVIPTKDLKSGMYCLKLRTGSEILSKTFVVK